LEQDGSISLNVVNLQFVLSLGASGDLGGFNNPGSSDTIALNGTQFLRDIEDFDISLFTRAIEKLSDMRAENGAEQNRLSMASDLLALNQTNLEAAHGRIMDADIALESTRMARQNVLVQASASMVAQANQLTSIALTVLG
jgi:flagellin